jgi:hypothetical protein
LFFAPSPATLASLISTSRSYLRAALIDVDNALKTRSPLSPKAALSSVARCAPDIHIRQYVYGSRSRTRYPFRSIRNAHSGVQLKPRPAVDQDFPFGNAAYSDVEPERNESLPAAEDPWLQSDAQSSDSGWVSPIDLHPQLRFDWRKRSLCREIILSTPDNRKRYPRRKIFVMEPIQHGEKYFDTIQSYQKQYAFTFFSLSLLMNACSRQLFTFIGE